MIKYVCLIVVFLLFRCASEVSSPVGLFTMVKSDDEKNYGIGCIPFTRAEQPFRIRFIDDKHLEFYPGIVKTTFDFTNQNFVGFKAKYKLDRNRLLIVPLQSTRDSLVYSILYRSSDSLVLKDESGSLEYYKKNQLDDTVSHDGFIWKIEVEASENISSCSPYKIVIDTTGMVSILNRGLVVDDVIAPEETNILFERINKHMYFQPNEETEQESDSRRIHFKAWTKRDTIEFENDLVYCSYELRRLLITLDDYVYNYSTEKQLIVQ